MIEPLQKVGKNKTYAWILACAAVLVVLSTCTWIYRTKIIIGSPIGKITESRILLGTATTSNAPIYAKEYYGISSLYYDSAMVHWKNENEKFPLFRDYSLSRYYADQASYWAQLSTNVARQGIDSLDNLFWGKHVSVKDKLEEYEKIYSKLPIDHQSFTRAGMYYNEAISLYRVKNHLGGLESMLLADSLVDAITINAKSILLGYFEEQKTWKTRIDRGIRLSKTERSVVLIIDKYGRKCYVYSRGKCTDTLQIELGTNWLGDKLHAGDLTTPEGDYEVAKKKSRGETRYHKALLLNYPNTEDRVRFLKNKSNGTIHEGVSIGGLIEIHGHGGKGIDWTDGCIALRNDDMDRVFDQSRVGTLVIIVGSVHPLNKILNEIN